MASPVPTLPPKKQRSGNTTTNTTASGGTICNAEHEYDEYCIQQTKFENKQQRQAARAALERLSSLTTTSSSSKHHHQGRSATFDVEDARDFELQRLGHRRSQQQQQLQLQLHNSKQTSVSAFHGSVGNSLGKHRGERTHDRERSRSDHRIASYICDDPAFCRLLPNGNMTSQAPQQQQQQSQSQQQQQQQPKQQHQTPQQLLLQRQQRREKTFKV